MNKKKFARASTLLLVPLVLAACQPQDFTKIKPDLGQIKNVSAYISGIGKKFDETTKRDPVAPENVMQLQLKDILEDSLATKNSGTDFLASIKYALNTDPVIVAKRREIEAKLASIDASEALKQFQVGTTLYGGIEDVTDKTKGLAVSINASRLVFDGGELDSQIASTVFEVEAARMGLAATVDQRANELFQSWLEVEKYKSLQMQIDKRLSVLDPLIDQLEKIAEAGIGDVSKVTAAQRTVSAIRVEKTSIAEGLAQAQLQFSNAFGVLNNGIEFDYDFITNLVPSEIGDNLVQKSPALRGQYASYQASLAMIRGAQSQRWI